ncbi:putative hydrolase of the HAD superfamily [Deinococcus metalli]|uniref:Putative hydrolase of the HAD superfamily n=1 Tax=Deinococcus metalli TaxID=1141878 RepID=A0A7W8KBM5_9DEIO|nr:HAD family hydrolase [Deinococcus metalli]MBB5375205.1 putative hydrolase of the HAD superfamily [Deinococcus metalli]GHF30983.1 hypothetical protein GCM10017781_03920 [Deinococcus metalli]
MKAVLFDLDGTMHDRRATLCGWLAGHRRRFGLPDAYAARFIELDDHGYRPKAEVLPQLVQEFGLGHDQHALLADFEEHPDLARPMAHAATVLAALRARGVRVGVVTNGRAAMQARTLRACGLADLLDDVVISEAVGLSKPDPRLYTLALARLGVAAADAWFVGDSPRNDVWGPQQVGLRSAFLPTGHPLAGEEPDATLRDLRDVLTLP